MNQQNALDILNLSNPFDKAAVKRAYIALANAAEDGIDDARDAAEEDAAWERLKQIQHARAFLLKTLDESDSQSEQTKAHPTHNDSPNIQAESENDAPMTIERAYALLSLSETHDLNAINQAAASRLEQIDGDIKQSDSEALWVVRSHVQQAQYCLQQHILANTAEVQTDKSKTDTSNTESTPKPQPIELDRKTIRALAQLNLTPPANMPQVRQRFSQMMEALDKELEFVKYAHEEDRISEQQRVLQRAFNHAKNGIERATPNTPNHSDTAETTTLSNQHKITAPILKPAIGMMILLVLIFGWWAFAPPTASPEQKAAAQAHQTVNALNDGLQAQYQAILKKTKEAGMNDSDDYAQWVNKRQAANERMRSEKASKLASLIKQANADFKAAQYEAANQKFEEAARLLNTIEPDIARIGTPPTP